MSWYKEAQAEQLPYQIYAMLIHADRNPTIPVADVTARLEGNDPRILATALQQAITMLRKPPSENQSVLIDMITRMVNGIDPNLEPEQMKNQTGEEINEQFGNEQPLLPGGRGPNVLNGGLQGLGTGGLVPN